MPIEAEFWVAVAFVIFLGILGHVGVYRKVLDALDRRRAAIRRELDEARAIRQEAEAVLCDAQRKRREAASEIDQVIDDARAPGAALHRRRPSPERKSSCAVGSDLQRPR